MQRFVCLLLFALVWVGPGEGFAQQPTVEERLIRLEEGQKALIQRVEDTNRRIEDTNRRVDDLRTDTNQRFEELRADMNQRFEELRADMNQRFADMMFWLQLVFGAVFATLGAVVAQWLTTMRRVSHIETQVVDHLRETEKDRLLMLQHERLEALTARLERVEAAGR